MKWNTKISKITDKGARVRGYELSSLAGKITFTEMIFLLLKGELPKQSEKEMLDAIFVISAEHGLGHRADRRIAEGETADLRRRGHVAGHQRGREREHLRVVVKPEARIVGGEQRRTINLQREQVSDRIDVLETVEPV